MSTALIVFAKAPVAGLAKTRLIPALGPDGAARLAERLLEHTLQQAMALPVEHLELCVSPTDLHPAFERARQAAPGRVHITWQGEGPGVDRLSPEIAKLPGVEAAAPFGITLHVSGTDERALDAALQPYRHAPYCWTRTQPTLEDAFIHLMGQSQDNFR